MFSASNLRSTGPRSVQATRSFKLKRKADYLRVPVDLPPKDPKSHDGPLKRQLKAFLGPRNIRGEYYTNKYCYPPQNHQPRYIDERNSPRVTPGAAEYTRQASRDLSKQPFPANQYTQTAQVISEDLKAEIFSQVVEKGSNAQEVAQRYGIRLPRVEALVKLQHIERQWKNENKITKDLDKFSKVMYKMFPLFYKPKHKDNLTEIPTPAKTLHQRFVTISESEPFGPVDAAKIFGLEPAQQTLDSLSEITEENDSRVRDNEVVVGLQKDGDDTQFRFTKATAGNVGYRYGASRRDKKRDRAVGFDRLGRMVYTV
ncbi:hypothetical protein FT663_02977 [Candidozyma haemuli var. vulneris]|uniref:37S ribosomal protein S35, mitochondrial n=1 Tax=Candidozyma haemuli TaxID=45357 RepID=A0A2V1AMZ3_9ASCO|nr:hypothetical protein CXQ85_001529 [[Candida] haemuloni]KAF3990904.1 hypothetical protein FT663_02977 [[Candida] haemuloni var. vulneris]KAF3992756.1 hypothetical protein FT662_00965 [[Candida] haemuloni var. vulneris]PVH19228.1 hypothetical protein CXQ85_001529 [[Candida] haemuloni]